MLEIYFKTTKRGAKLNSWSNFGQLLLYFMLLSLTFSYLIHNAANSLTVVTSMRWRKSCPKLLQNLIGLPVSYNFAFKIILQAFLHDVQLIYVIVSWTNHSDLWIVSTISLFVCDSWGWSYSVYLSSTLSMSVLAYWNNWKMSDI